VDKISAFASAQNLRIWDVIETMEFPPRTKNALLEFVALIKGFQATLSQKNAYEIAMEVTRSSGLMDELKKDTTIEGISRLDNISALLDGIKTFVEDPPEAEESDQSLSAYLQNIALLTDMDEQTQEKDFITLMSVHSAKGLEFKSVFVVGLEENLFPSYMSMDSHDGLEEERRLFYVAITRAEQLLTLSFAENRYRFGNIRSNEPSRFLNELPGRFVESTAALNFSKHDDEPSPSASGVQGIPIRKSKPPVVNVDPANFKPSPPEAIKTGQRVLHLKFGEGTVCGVDGHKDNLVAVVKFDADSGMPDRRLMLRFAKLQIL
jgi:DNA helicase-2/ATP-dependent DNA helicase PcrA